MQAICEKMSLFGLFFIDGGGLRNSIKDCCCWTMTGWCSAVCHHSQSHSLPTLGLSLDISSFVPASSAQLQAAWRDYRLGAALPARL